MRKKYYILSVVGVLIIFISFGLGYTNAYIHSLGKSMDMQVRINSGILITSSSVLSQKLKSPDMAELIDATEENGDSLSVFIIQSKHLIEDPETRKLAEIALTSWEKAKERLQELRALRSRNN
jgi:hypothetical protein